jgi:hypothetical protein
MVDSTIGDLLLVIFTIATATGMLILIDNRVSVMVPQNNARWYARHILTFPAQRATCPARPDRHRVIQKETGQHDVKVQHVPMTGKRGHKCASQQDKPLIIGTGNALVCRSIV